MADRPLRDARRSCRHRLGGDLRAHERTAVRVDRRAIGIGRIARRIASGAFQIDRRAIGIDRRSIGIDHDVVRIASGARRIDRRAIGIDRGTKRNDRAARWIGGHSANATARAWGQSCRSTPAGRCDDVAHARRAADAGKAPPVVEQASRVAGHGCRARARVASASAIASAGGDGGNRLGPRVASGTCAAARSAAREDRVEADAAAAHRRLEGNAAQMIRGRRCHGVAA